MHPEIVCEKCPTLISLSWSRVSQTEHKNLSLIILSWGELPKTSDGYQFIVSGRKNISSVRPKRFRDATAKTLSKLYFWLLKKYILFQKCLSWFSVRTATLLTNLRTDLQNVSNPQRLWPRDLVNQRSALDYCLLLPDFSCLVLKS